MILFTHAIVGGAIASLLPEQPWAPVVGAAAGFASHFLIDAIPHWDYPIRSAFVKPNVQAPLSVDLALMQDVMVIGFDGLAGMIAAIGLFATASSFCVIAVSAIAAMLPDPLQFVHSRFPRGPLRALQRFHVWAHTKQPLQQVFIGIASQLIFIIAVVSLAMYLNPMFR
jgi:hypothetical protein